MSRVCKRCGGDDFYLNRSKQCVPCTQARQLRYYAEDPTRRIINACQVRLRYAHKELGLVAPKNVFRLLGCSKHELLRHLEERFKEGMTWENYGTVWHMGHRVPMSAFPQDADGIALAPYYKNLQPILIAEHKAKTRAEVKSLNQNGNGTKAVANTARFQTRPPSTVPTAPSQAVARGDHSFRKTRNEAVALVYAALCTVLRASL